MKRLGVLLLSLDGMLVHQRVPSMKRLGVLLLSLDGMLVHHSVSSINRGVATRTHERACVPEKMSKEGESGFMYMRIAKRKEFTGKNDRTL